MTILRHDGSVPLQTERLFLRPYRPEDEQAIFENWASDPEVTRYLSWRAHASRKVTRDVLDSWCRHETEKTYRWAITLKPTAFPGAVEDEPVGQIDVVRVRENGCAELGWVLSRRYWGQGIMTEAARAVARYLLEQVGFPGLYSRHDLRNPASGKVMQKIGMRYCGQMDGGADNCGQPCTVAEYCLLQEGAASVSVRPAAAEDVPVVGRLYDAVCDAQPKQGDKESVPGWIRGIYPIELDAREAFDLGELYVAHANGCILGTVVLNEEQSPAYANANWQFPAERALVVHTLAIHPDSRGQGVASALMLFAEKLAKERGISVIRLDTYAKNYPARHLYERLQYHRAGDIDLGIAETFGINCFCTYEKKLSE